jgi:pimeloyl-[acyl-carrier protein] methyl ester esterase
MTLHVEVQGRGPALVLLHGWGLHGGVWEPLLPELTPRFTVHVVDLPGHGYSRGLAAPSTAEEMARPILASLPQPATWLGWSLGGIVALAAARLAPATVQRLALVGATPKFAQSPDWPHGMPLDTLRAFADELERDYRGVLLRFLSLQLGNGEAQRALLRTLRASLFSRGEPSVASLRAGLAILEDSDLRASLGEIAAPALVVHGARDRLVPVEAGEHLAAHLRRATLRRLEADGHAPFLSRPQEFARWLTEFGHE